VENLKFKENSAFASLLLPVVAIAALMALLAQGPNEPKVLFMMVVVALWFGCSGSVREIVDELPIYRRERQRDLKLVSYIGSKLVYAGIVAAAQALLLVAVLAVMGALKGHLPKAYLLTWLMTFEGALTGLVISAVCPTADATRMAYSYQLLSAVAITLHQNDSADARTELSGTEGETTQPLETFGRYLAILFGFALLFISAITAALKRKESHGKQA